MWWEPIFCVYWCWLIKYINPAILFYIFMGILIDDIRKPYEGYGAGWQAVGWTIPILGFLMFVGSFVLFSEPDYALNYEEFELTEFMTPEQLEYWKSKEISAEADANQVAPDADPKAEGKGETELV